jgi:hypothetical protein
VELSALTIWSVEAMDVCFIVRDVNGQALAYVYFEEEPGRRSSKTAAKAGLSRTSGHPTRARGLSFSCNPASVDLNQMPSLSAGGGSWHGSLSLPLPGYWLSSARLGER